MEEILEIPINNNLNLTSSSQCNEETMGPKRDSIYIIIPIIIIYVIIFLTGTIGNISTCIVIFRNKSMHTATNYYLFSLAISDLLLLISGLPPEIYSIYSRYPYIFGSVFCFLRGMFAETSANATVLTITAFTIERYLAICHPFLSHTMSKLSRAVKLILIIWLLAICLAIPQAMQFKLIGGDDDDCKMCVFYEPIIEHSFELSTILFFILPMTLITVLYVLIGQKLKNSNMMKKQRNTNNRMPNKSSKKVVKMLVAVVVAFFICWAPFHAQRLYTAYSSLSKHDAETYSMYLKIYEIVTYISGILYYVSATINPILYNIMSVKFREAFKETFTRCCGIGHYKNTKPQRSYSALSRSAQRAPDSTDSGRDEQPSLHTHTTITQKSSIESVNGLHSNIKRYKPLCLREDGIEEENFHNESASETKFITINMNTTPASAPTTTPTTTTTATATTTTTTRLNKFWQYFHCLAKRTFDESNKRLSTFYESPIKEPNIIFELENTPKKQQQQQQNKRCTSPCDISNSSLKDIDNGAIEDELTTYMKEIRRREYCS